jgi:hypothetical protein
MTAQTINAIRARAWMFLNPDVAACAGLALAELQQFAAGTPKLARRMNLTLATEHTHG